MDWKLEAIDKLKHYAARSQSLIWTADELQTLSLQLTAIRSGTSDSTPVSGGGGGREDAIISNIAKRRELRLTRLIAKRLVKQVDDALGMLDEQERIILDRFFIHHAKGNVERLCGELNLEKTQVYSLKDRALRRFTITLYGLAEL